ncbi:MAG TPA: endonuclease III domain-containing protein [Dehalococcoidia bacterium]
MVEADAGLLRAVYRRLLAAYGPQGWWPAETPFEVCVGAILTQSAAWSNVERAIANLRAAGALTPEGLRALPEAELARLVYPAGYFRAKARKLKAFTDLLFGRFGGSLEALLALPAAELRAVLLGTHGIGPETADCILLYAAGRPSFVVDAYTRRTFGRLGVRPERDTYQAWQALFTAALPADPALYNEYHALLVAHGKAACRKEPRCGGCPLLDLCPTGRSEGPGPQPAAAGREARGWSS